MLETSSGNANISKYPMRFSTCATLIVNNDHVIAAKLRHLENIPNITGAGRFAEEHKRRPPAVCFIINIDIVEFDERHSGSLSRLSTVPL
jgi:hypothetical protein